MRPESVVRRREWIRRKRMNRQAEARQLHPAILLNPVVLYSAVWIAAVILCWTRWASFMGPISPRFLLLVGGDIAVSAVAYTLVAFFLRQSPGSKRGRPAADRFGAIASPTVQAALNRYANLLFTLWGVGCVVNTYASGGLPIVWRLQGIARTYADYGIPTFSGLVAACGLFASMGFFLLQKITGNKRRWWAIVMVLGFQVATLNRGGAVWIILELTGIFLQFGRFRPGRILRGVALALLLIILFGVMGNSRTGGDTNTVLRSLANDRGTAIFQHLPSGFWWTYLYASVGSANLNEAIDHIKPLGRPYWSVTYLFPSVIRIILYPETVYEARYPLAMANTIFNVFSMYGGYIADFGMAGCYAVTLLLQLLASLYFIRARRGDASSILAYAVCFQIIITSLFSDSLTSWVAIFQFVLAFGFRLFMRASVPISRTHESTDPTSPLLRSLHDYCEDSDGAEASQQIR